MQLRAEDRQVLDSRSCGQRVISYSSSGTKLGERHIEEEHGGLFTPMSSRRSAAELSQRNDLLCPGYLYWGERIDETSKSLQIC